MKRMLARLAWITLMTVASAPVYAASALTPGTYEYTIRMSMPGVPANIPTQVSQRCLSPGDVEGSKAYEMPPDRNSDCQVKDMTQGGGQFSYKVTCTKPQKIDGDVKGSVTSNSLTMDMTMVMAGTPGPMTQNITARRIGDCKP